MKFNMIGPSQQTKTVLYFVYHNRLLDPETSDENNRCDYGNEVHKGYVLRSLVYIYYVARQIVKHHG